VDVFKNAFDAYALYLTGVAAARERTSFSGEQLLSVLSIRPNNCTYAETQLLNRFLKQREDGK
jgi:hypothetical protein